MEIHIVDQYREFLELREQWNVLLKRSLHPIVFLTHQWVDTWWKAFGTGKSLFILLVYDGNELTAIAPLMIHEGAHVILGKPHIAIRARKIEFIANVHSNRADIILGNKPAEACEKIINFLTDDCSNYWDIMSLEYLLVDSPSFMFLENALKKKNISYKQYSLISSPYVPINCTWNEYAQSLSKKHKNNIARRIKKMSIKGAPIIKKCHDTSDLAPILDHIFTVAAESWKAKENTALSSNDQSRAFYADLAYTAAKEGWLEIYILYLGQVPVVFNFALVFENRLLLLKTEYDENYSEYGVGHALILTQLKSTFSRGLTEFDFLGPSMPWKKIYCNDTVKEHISLHVYNKNYKGSLLNYVYCTKDILKKLIRHTGSANSYQRIEKIKQNQLFPLEADATDIEKKETIHEQGDLKEDLFILTEKDGDVIKPQNQNYKDILEEEKIVQLIDERTKARQDRNWQRADEIREFLSEKGVEINDSRQGTTWCYKNSNIRMDGLEGSKCSQTIGR